MEKIKNDPSSALYKAVQALKKAGVPLDKLFRRVEKSHQVKKEQEKEQQKKDKATILANLNDWVVHGPNSIFNSKTQQGLNLNGENFSKHRFYTEYSVPGGKDPEEDIIESYFDAATFQELRTAIFQNMLKNLRTNKNYFDQYNKNFHLEILEKRNYSSTEWNQIQKALGKEVSAPESSGQNSPNNSSLKNKLIVAGTVASLVILAVGGLFLIKKLKKSRSKK